MGKGKARPQAWLLLFLLSGWMACSGVFKGSAQAELPDQLRVGVYQLSKDNMFVLLGINKGNLRATLGKDQIFNLNQLGFKGEDLGSVDPKFLISFNKYGPVDAYSFELGSASSGDDLEEPGLPHKFLDAQYPRKSLVARLLRSVVMNIAALGSVVAAPIMALFGELEQQGENPKNREAVYLQTLLDLALDEQKFPALRKALSDDQMKLLGSAISVRYHRERDYGGIFVSNGDRVSYYDSFRVARYGLQVNNLQKLVRGANLNGFVVIPMGTRFAWLFYDPENKAPKEHYKELLMDAKNPEAIEAGYQTVSYEKGKLIPLGLFAMNESWGPTELVDPQAPMENAWRERKNSLVTLAKEVGYSFIPIPYIKVALRIVDGVAYFVTQKSGSSTLNYRIRAYGEFPAIFETGLIDIDVDDIAISALIERLKEWNLSEVQIQSFANQLRSTDTEQVRLALSELLHLMGEAEYRETPILAGEDNQEYRLKKEGYMTRLSVFLRNAKAVKKLNKHLDDRAEQYQDDYEDYLKELAKFEKFEANFNFDPKVPQQLKESDGTSQAILADVSKLDHEKRKPVIMFLVDGLRPDRLEKWIDEGLLPNIKKAFFDRGVKFDSYVSRSVTIPSWATILSGWEPDEHGIRSNSPASRLKGGSSENFDDPRKDLLLPKYIAQGRSFRRMRESGVTWLPQYYEQDQVLTNFLPINDSKYPPVGRLIGNFLSNIDKAIYGIFSGVSALDSVSGDGTAEEILDDEEKAQARERRGKPGDRKLRLVINWYASIDSHSHMNDRAIPDGLKVVDHAVGQVLNAASKHGILKDAALVLTSDHGHLGGAEQEDAERHFMPEEHHMVHTPLNLMYYFAGDYIGRYDYRFVTLSKSSPHPDYDLTYLSEFLINPYSYVYRGHLNNPGERNLLVDFTGDNLAQVYFRPQSGEWRSLRRLSYYDLTHYQSEVTHPKTGKKNLVELNIPKDLLNYSLVSTNNHDVETRRRILQFTGNRPVRLVAMALQGKIARVSADALASNEETGASDRDPVLVIDKEDRAGLILTRRKPGFEDEFRYLVIKGFGQDENGRIRGEVTNDPSLDPLQLYGSVLNGESGETWRSDREWLSLTAGSNHEQPTAIFSLPRLLTLSPRLSLNPYRVAEIPDMVLLSNRGFNFSSGKIHMGDHGGVWREESNNTLLISGLGERCFGVGQIEAKGQTLNRDVAPTVLEYSGVDPRSRMQGKSLYGTIETLREHQSKEKIAAGLGRCD